jgi:S1-C subfamily serine protease
VAIASVVAAVAFLAWLAWVTPESPATPGTSSVASPGSASQSAAVSSGFAGTPAAAAPQSAAHAGAAPQDDATPPTVPLEVQEATDRRQSEKITRGMRSNPEGGVRIDATPPGSVASQMHLLPGDVLKAVNNQPVSSPEDFARIYRSEGAPGEFVVIRDGREIHRR